MSGLRYGMGPEVLRDISFHIAPHSFQFLTGPSGAGKTTLLRLLFLSLKPTRGLINLFGHDVAHPRAGRARDLRRRIGVVFQDFRLLDHMTTYENVALPLRVRGREEASYRADVIELLNWVGLGERMHVAAAGPFGRREAARGDRARPDRQPAAPARRRADRQCRSAAGAAAAAPVHRAQQVGTAVVIATHDIGLMDQFDAPPAGPG